MGWCRSQTKSVIGDIDSLYVSDTANCSISEAERESVRDLEAVKLPISLLISITGRSQSSHMIDS